MTWIFVKQNATPWTPANLPSLFGWYDATAITGLSDGASITTWSDSSSNANDLTSYGTITYETSEINSLPVVRLTSGELSAGSKTWGYDGITIAIVATRDTAYTVNAFYFGSLNGYALGTLGSLKLYANIYKSDGTRYVVSDPAGGPTIGAAPFMLLMRGNVNTGAFQLRHDGTSYYNGDGLSGTTTTMAANLTHQTTFGGSPGRGDLGEGLIIPGRVSDADADRIEGYLAHKWGLASNLPAGHPYKTAAPTA